MPAALLVLSEMALNGVFIAGFVLGARVALFASSFLRDQLK